MLTPRSGNMQIRMDPWRLLPSLAVTALDLFGHKTTAGPQGRPGEDWNAVCVSVSGAVTKDRKLGA